MKPLTFVAVGSLLTILMLAAPLSARAPGTGACCFPDDICLEGIEGGECELIEGTYLGDGSTCDGDEDGDGAIGCDDLCPGTPPDTPVDENGCPTVGACCFPYVQVCLDGLDESTCSEVNGVYKGTGSICSDPQVCPPLCEGDANADGVVDPLDSGFVLARFGCAVGDGDPLCDASDANGDGVVDPLDTGFILARFGTCVISNPCTDGEGSVPVGCRGFDEVALAVTPFPGSKPPDPLPTQPVTVLVGDPWGVVVDVGDLGNNVGTLLLLVTLDDNQCNGNTGVLLDASFIDSGVVFTILALPSNDTGTFYVVATLFSADASEVGCDNIAQVYNSEVTITFVKP